MLRICYRGLKKKRTSVFSSMVISISTNYFFNNVLLRSIVSALFFSILFIWGSVVGVSAGPRQIHVQSPTTDAMFNSFLNRINSVFVKRTKDSRKTFNLSAFGSPRSKISVKSNGIGNFFSILLYCRDVDTAALQHGCSS